MQWFLILTSSYGMLEKPILWCCLQITLWVKIKIMLPLPTYLEKQVTSRLLHFLKFLFVRHKKFSPDRHFGRIDNFLSCVEKSSLGGFNKAQPSFHPNTKTEFVVRCAWNSHLKNYYQRLLLITMYHHFVFHVSGSVKVHENVRTVSSTVSTFVLFEITHVDNDVLDQSSKDDDLPERIQPAPFSYRNQKQLFVPQKPLSRL